MTNSDQSSYSLERRSQVFKQRLDLESNQRLPSLTAAAAEFNRNHSEFIKSTTFGLLSAKVDERGGAIIGDGLLYASGLNSKDLHPAVSRFFRSCQIDDFLNELNLEDGLGPRLFDISMTEEDVNLYYHLFCSCYRLNDEVEATTRLGSLMLAIFNEKSGIRNAFYEYNQEWGMLAGGLLAFATDRDPNPSQPAAFAFKADFVALNEKKSNIKACMEIKKRQVRRDSDGTRSFDGPDSLKVQTLGNHFGSGAKFTLAVRMDGFTGIFNRRVSTDVDDVDVIECYMTPVQGMNQFDFFHVRHAFLLALYGIVRICAYTFTPGLAPVHVDLSMMTPEEKIKLSASKPQIEHPTKASASKRKLDEPEEPVKVKRFVLDSNGDKHLITGLNATNSNPKEKIILEEIGEYMHMQKLEQGLL